MSEVMQAMAYTPLPEDECVSMNCRREGWNPETGDIGKCVGYHCAKCGKPSGQYGHYIGKRFTCVGLEE